MRLFGEITRIEDLPDGSLRVYGVASTGARDEVGEIVLPAAMKAALPDYARYPALREMHQPAAAGRTLEATVDDEGATRIVAQVVDPVAIAKVKSRTYSGFSIGGRVLARDAADPTVITRIKLSEISLVDRPANPEAVIDLWKAAPDAAPGNAAVKARAADLARRAGRPPAAAWKDYVAKARADLVAEFAKAANDPDDDASDDAPDEDDADGDGDDTTADDLGDDGEGSDDASDDEMSDDGDGDDGDDDAAASADTPADIAGRLATLAASDPEALQAAHDALAALGAVCDPDNCPDTADKHLTAGDLAKLDGGSLVDALLAKALPRVEALERRIAEQDALIERIAAAPQPPRTAASAHAHAIGKADDADPGADSAAAITPAEAQKAFAALSPDERAFLLMKASLRQPIPLP